MPDPMPGALVAGAIFQERYEIVRCLKSGGMGAVYECVHLKTRKRRALKVMLPEMVADAGLRERFELEARVTADIESDHIVETFDAGVDPATNAPFLVMELLRGDDLGAILKKSGPIPAAEVVRLLTQAAKALDQTHAAGIVHRDLKPENLFLATRGDGSSILKILDFGIAKVIADGNRATHATAGIGTPLYMSPEQLTGDAAIGPPSDLYALGHIAFALLAGQGYWEEERLAEAGLYAFLGRMIEGAKEAPTARATRFGVTLPAAFDPWFARATARSPFDRFERATAMVEDLVQVLGATERASGVRPSPTSTALGLASSATTGSAPRARGWQRVAVAAVVSGAIAAGAMAWRARTASVTPDSGRPAASAITEVAPPPAPSAPPPTPTPEVVPPSTAAAPEPQTSSSGGAASGPTSRAASQPSATTTAGPSRVRPTSSPTTPLPKAPASKAKGCVPPYVIDGAGHKQYKPECL
jgi:serine/threonine-protein kinase